jgi:hypothetical protein
MAGTAYCTGRKQKDAHLGVMSTEAPFEVLQEVIGSSTAPEAVDDLWGMSLAIASLVCIDTLS